MPSYCVTHLVTERIVHRLAFIRYEHYFSSDTHLSQVPYDTFKLQDDTWLCTFMS